MDLMPFGRYRGHPLSALPDDYFAWLRALPDLRPRLRAAVDAEAERRGIAADEPKPAATAEAHDPPVRRRGGVIIDLATARARLCPRAQREEECR